MTLIPMVFIVDDDLSVQKSLGRLVRSAGFRAVAFGSANEFLSFSWDDAPSCLVLDIQMPDLCGFGLQQTLSASGLRLPIIFLTGYGDIPMSVRAIKAGAVDFLTKPCDDKELLRAIELAIAINLEARRELTDIAELQRRLSSLTRREREVCNHVVAGRLNKQIAHDLGVCEQTIKVHRMKIMKKLRVRSLADLVRLTEKAGMMSTTSKNST